LCFDSLNVRLQKLKARNDGKAGKAWVFTIELKIRRVSATAAGQ
jgi:hypothetical protein